jgi:hypothetical protein
MPIVLIYLVLWSRAHCSERDLIEPVRVLDSSDKHWDSACFICEQAQKLLIWYEDTSGIVFKVR